MSLVLDLLAGGWTVEQLLDEYPGVEEADVLACIAYGAEMSRTRYVDVPESAPVPPSSVAGVDKPK